VKIEEAVLQIEPAGPAALWRIEVSWILIAPYWETGSWCSETVELVEGEPGEGGTPIVRWRSDPWRIEAQGTPADGSQLRIRRSVPSQLAGPAVLDVHPDNSVLDIVGIRTNGRGLLLRLSRQQRLDQVHAMINVQPAATTGDSVETGVVAAQFGAPQ